MISYYDELHSKIFSTHRFAMQEDLIESISKYVSVSENEKLNLVQNVTDMQTESNSKKTFLSYYCVKDERSEKCLACEYT